MKEKEKEKVYEFFNIHKSAFGNWQHGNPVKYWKEGEVICIMYEDLTWWHYRMNKGKLEWW